MKGLVVLLAAGVTAAHAQSERTRMEFLPMPNTLPLVFFAPDSLAGAMLEPFDLPEEAQRDPAAAEAVAGDPAAPPGAADPAAEAALLEIQAQADPDQLAAPQVPVVPETELEAGPEPGLEPGPELGLEPGPELGLEPDETAAVEEPATDETELSTVHIIVENVQSDSGRVNVAVCDTALSEDGCPYHTSVPAALGYVEATIGDIPPGVYAVVSYHDVNGNDQFDKFLAMPREPYALSGAAAEVLIPQFDDATLDINKGENFVIIRLKRMGEG